MDSSYITTAHVVSDTLMQHSLIIDTVRPFAERRDREEAHQRESQISVTIRQSTPRNDRSPISFRIIEMVELMITLR